MKKELLKLLICPSTGQKLYLQENDSKKNEVLNGTLITKDKKHSYSIKDGIPRFVPESNYADNFGMQWNHFRKTQLDSYSGQSISSDRFWMATGWTKEEIEGI